MNIDSSASCGTFPPLNAKGGLDVVAQVGACPRQDCVHNADLQCRAPPITVGSTSADGECLSYRAA